MKPRSRRACIVAQLADLKSQGILEALGELLSGVDGGGFTAGEVIERLLATRIALHSGRRLTTAIRSSRLPGLKALAEFDSSFQPSIQRNQIDSLHDLGLLERRANVVFLGPLGVGKTHLAISLAVGAALLDRLLHRCHIVNIRGNSCRMRRHMEFSKAVQPTASRAVSAETARMVEAS